MIGAKKNSENNNNINNSNGGDTGGINDNKTELVGAIVHADKNNNTRTMEKVVALVDAGHYKTMCDEGDIMTEEEFNYMINEEEYNKEYDAQIYDDGPIG